MQKVDAIVPKGINKIQASIKTLPNSMVVGSLGSTRETSLKPLVFRTHKTLIRVGVAGEGTVEFFVGSQRHVLVLTDTIKYYEFNQSNPGDNCYFEYADGFYELDLSNNQIAGISINTEMPIRKLVVYSNCIRSLDCSRLKQLKYLHMHDNPMCDDDTYRDALNQCINSLPDRTDSSIGSITLYPWYGLETLICEQNNKYYKYPIDDWEDSDGSSRKAYNLLGTGNNLIDRDGRIILNSHATQINYSGDRLTLTSTVSDKTWSSIQYAIPNHSALVDKEITLSGSFYGTANNKVGCSLYWSKQLQTGEIFVRNWVSDKPTTFTLTKPDDADVLIVVFYLNKDGDLKVGDSAVFDNIQLVCEGSLSYQIKPNTLYGLVKNNQITYYVGSADGLVEHVAMNRHHTIRKQLENQTIFKNWMFGSAIQYHDEYKYCHYYFRDVGAQDVWETAEKGFGIRIGSMDQYPGKALGWSDMNVIANVDFTGGNIVPYYVADRKIDRDHGDGILSQIVGRGMDNSYGICPNASVFLVDTTGYTKTNLGMAVAWQKGIEKITRNCTSYTSSTITGYTGSEEADTIYHWAVTRRILGEFGRNNIITCSAGNNGDGLPWTNEQNGQKAIAYGDFGTQENVLSIENHSSTFFVGALSPSRQPSTFSNNTTATDYTIPTIGKVQYTPTEDYLSGYGEQILGYNNIIEGMSCAQGTSMSSPNCNATLVLMRVIYSKINPRCVSFGKGSEFMDYVKTHWIDPIENEMDFAVGIGIPVFNAETRNKVKLLEENCGLLSQNNLIIGKSTKVIDMPIKDQKSGVTFQKNFKHLAQIGPNEMVPIRPGKIEINAYSNSSLLNPVDLKQNYYSHKLNFNIAPSDAKFSLVQDGVVDSQLLNNEYIISTEQADEYTVSFVLELSGDRLFEPQEVGRYTGNIDLIHFFEENQKKAALSVCNITCNAYRDEQNRLLSNLVFKYWDESSKNDNKYTTNMLFAQTPYDYPSISARLATQDALQAQENDNVVITLVSKNKLFYYYYNGNLMNVVCQGIYNTHLLQNCKILIKPLKHNSQSDVVFYNRALSHEEVANNTISLLEREER